MSKRSPKSVEEKLEVVQLLLTHEKSISQLSKQCGVSESVIKSWKAKYEKAGKHGLKKSLTWKKYSKEVKK
ncbi:transposase [Streptococcus hongkongensis]|nr:transposase [Streptococcus uberis]